VPHRPPPDQVRETVWLRHCARTLSDRRELPRRNKWRILAELSFEVFPERCPDAEPGTDAFNEALRREADRIRKNLGALARFKACVLGRPDDPSPDPISED
jgi:hypothetical protein